MKTIASIDLGTLPQPEISFAGFEPNPNAMPERTSGLKPIESAQQFFSIVEQMRRRDAAYDAARRAEELERPKRQAAERALRQRESQLAEVRGRLAWIRSMLGQLNPPAGSREHQLARSLISCMDAFANAEVQARDRLEVAP